MSHLFEGKTLERPFLLFGCVGLGRTDPYVDPDTWMQEAAEDLASKAGLLRDREVFRPLCILCGYYGVHFVDRMFGAHMYELRERNNWQVAPLDQPIGRLEPPDLTTDETWALARRFAEAFLALGASVPLFGLPTIANALNIGVNLYGQELLMAFLENPEAAHHDLRVINDVLCAMHRWYLGRTPMEQFQPLLPHTRCQPPGHGQLCGCSTQLPPPDLYAEFVAPLDDELLSVYPKGGMIHLCGTHAQHIPVWRGMKSLKAVQLNDRAAEDLEVYWTGLRPDQVLYVNPCPGMPVERILDITGGRRVVIIAETRQTTEEMVDEKFEALDPWLPRPPFRLPWLHQRPL